MHLNRAAQRVCKHSAQVRFLFFFNDTATTEIYTLSLHDALPIYLPADRAPHRRRHDPLPAVPVRAATGALDRKSTRLNSSHTVISYAVFCLKKKNRRNSLVRSDDADARLRPRQPAPLHLALSRAG